MTTNAQIERNLNSVHQHIRTVESRFNRPTGSVRLIAVSKTRSTSEIRLAAKNQQFEFGESYVQEAIDKIESLSDLDLTWHFIGPIQKNKTKAIAQHFNWVHSIDRAIVATRLHDQRPDNMTPINVCVQINIDKEDTKSGVLPNQLLDLAEHISRLTNLRLRGLMAIPAPTQDFNRQVETFKRVRDYYYKLRKHGLDVDTLSMGMSNDYEAAIAAGSTMVRIGTAIFGPRQTT